MEQYTFDFHKEKRQEIVAESHEELKVKMGDSAGTA
jgi:hypothetical protein